MAKLSDLPTIPSRETQDAETSDKHLLELHLSGDGDAFRVLVERHQQWLFGYLVNQSRCPDTARDLFQEVLLRVARGASGFGGRARFSTWLFTITSNVLRDHRRRQLRERVRDVFTVRGQQGTEAMSRTRTSQQTAAAIEEVPDSRPDPEQEVEGRERLARVSATLARLPERQRRVLLLVNVEGMSLQRAADTLGLNLNTVKTLLRRGRLGLARRLAEGECA